MQYGFFKRFFSREGTTHEFSSKSILGNKTRTKLKKEPLYMSFGAKSMFCYGLGFKDYLFDAVGIAVTKSTSKENPIEFVKNFYDSVTDCFEVIQNQKAPFILLASILTKEIEIQAKDLLVSLRSLDNDVSKVPVIVITFTHEDRVDPIFKAGKCHILRLPCEILKLSTILEQQSITEKEKLEFLTRFGREYLIEKVTKQVSILAHDFPKKMTRLKNVVKQKHVERLEEVLTNAHAAIDLLFKSRLPKIESYLNGVKLTITEAYPEIKKLQEIFSGLGAHINELSNRPSEIISILDDKLAKGDDLIEGLRRRSFRPRRCFNGRK